jgi:hypothetical protein
MKIMHLYRLSYTNERVEKERKCERGGRHRERQRERGREKGREIGKERGGQIERKAILIG